MGSPNKLSPYWRCKHDRKNRRQSQTAGRTKTGCKATVLDRYMCKCSRSYKDIRYSAWFDGVLNINGGSK
jgi:hypothetical protein